ncbi:MAG TPA: histidine phosphatase family protein [Candidatus Polarisedimenticolia bacterium]|nr:histidine phosphatase family protein [Candidatus Polarisedimenticolia bacterium]
MRCRVTFCSFAAIAAIASTTALQAKADLVILVRHAEKSSGADDPDLAPAGRERAEALARALAHVPLTAVITTQYRRTALTAAPAARQQNLAPRVVASAGDVAAHAAAIAAALGDLPDGTAALVVGHSNTIAPIIAALGGPQVPNLCDAEHGILYVLHRSKPDQPARLLKSRYGAPDPPQAEACAVSR